MSFGLRKRFPVPSPIGGGTGNRRIGRCSDVHGSTGEFELGVVGGEGPAFVGAVGKPPLFKGV